MDQSTVFCIVSFDFNCSRSPKIQHLSALVCRWSVADIRRFVCYDLTSDRSRLLVTIVKNRLLPRYGSPANMSTPFPGSCLGGVKVRLPINNLIGIGEYSDGLKKQRFLVVAKFQPWINLCWCS